MPLQIVEFKGVRQLPGATAQIADGPPSSVSDPAFTGAFTVGDGVQLVKLSGSGTVLWSGAAHLETILGVEYRGARHHRRHRRARRPVGVGRQRRHGQNLYDPPPARQWVDAHSDRGHEQQLHALRRGHLHRRSYCGRRE